MKYPSLKRMKLSELAPADYNPRTISTDSLGRLTKSLSELGNLQPITFNVRTGHIVGGHQRLKCLKALGHEETEVWCVELNEVQEKAANIALNKLSGDFDMPALKDLLSELDASEIDLDITGFSDEELQDLLGDNSLEPIDDDAVIPIDSVKVITQKGDLFELVSSDGKRKHRLLCGDSTLSENISKVLNQQTPHLMVTDPPYGVEYDPSWREGFDLGVGKRSKGKVQNDDRFDWTEVYQAWLCEVAYIWHGAKSSYEVAQNLKDSGFEIVSQIIWAKQHFVLSRGNYHWQHEPCWYAVKKGKNHHWQGARDQSTLWEILNNNHFGNAKAEETWGHGTQKPLECMQRPIRNNSKEGDVVCDPFLGSGTTLIAAEQIGRVCYGMELSEVYCDVIVKRFLKTFPNTKVLRNGKDCTDLFSQ
jgi:DNA modification methylase